MSSVGKHTVCPQSVCKFEHTVRKAQLGGSSIADVIRSPDTAGAAMARLYSPVLLSHMYTTALHLQVFFEIVFLATQTLLHSVAV